MKKLKLQTPKQKIHTMTSHPADADASAVSLAAKVVKNVDNDEKTRSEFSAAKRAPVVAAEVS